MTTQRRSLRDLLTEPANTPRPRTAFDFKAGDKIIVDVRTNGNERKQSARHGVIYGVTKLLFVVQFTFPNGCKYYESFRKHDVITGEVRVKGA